MLLDVQLINIELRMGFVNRFDEPLFY